MSILKFSKSIICDKDFEYTFEQVQPQGTISGKVRTTNVESDNTGVLIFFESIDSNIVFNPNYFGLHSELAERMYEQYLKEQ